MVNSPSRRLQQLFALALVAFAGAACGAGPQAAASQTAAQDPVAPTSLAEQIGSTRNARIAVPAPIGEPLLFLAGDIEPDVQAELARSAPNVRLIAGLDATSALQHAAEARGVVANLVTPEFLANAPRLVWIQAMSAGVDRYSAWPKVASGEVVLTNLRAVHGPAIADHAFAMLLAQTRGLRQRIADQKEEVWRREVAGPEPIALQGRTMLVVGLGGIGSEVAQRAHGFGMRVIATRRSDTPGPAFVERVGRPQDLLAMLPQADVVAICLPLTDETRQLFDARAFAAMRPGAILINVGRGPIVQTDALLAALDAGRLAGVCLDVTDPEPLPAGHSLWQRPEVLITPHVSARSQLTGQRGEALFVENVRRFGAGEPLLNVVDAAAGY